MPVIKITNYRTTRVCPNEEAHKKKREETIKGCNNIAEMIAAVLPARFSHQEYCNECGERIVVKVNTEIVDVCERCHNPVSEGDRYCGTCGDKLVGEPVKKGVSKTGK